MIWLKSLCLFTIDAKSTVFTTNNSLKINLADFDVLFNVA
jgi:hypothetical protein